MRRGRGCGAADRTDLGGAAAPAMRLGFPPATLCRAPPGKTRRRRSGKLNGMDATAPPLVTPACHLGVLQPGVYP